MVGHEAVCSYLHVVYGRHLHDLLTHRFDVRNIDEPCSTIRGAEGQEITLEPDVQVRVKTRTFRQHTADVCKRDADFTAALKGCATHGVRSAADPGTLHGNLQRTLRIVLSSSSIFRRLPSAYGRAKTTS